MKPRWSGLRKAALAAAALALVSSGIVAAPAIADTPTPRIIDFPVALTPTQIAIDGDTVALASGTVSVQNVDFSGGTVGASTNVGTQAFSSCSGTSVRTYIYSPTRCQMLAQSNGETLWSRFGSAGVSTLAGPATIVTSPHTGAFISTAAVSGKWILTADEYLIDSTTGQSTTTYGSESDLLDGVEYVPGDVQLTTTASVLARNLNTGVGSAIAVPECADVEQVQAAGSWLLVTCELTDTTQSYVVVDRTGTTPDRTVPITGDYVLLGNGFLARETPTGEVEWSALNGTSLDWAQLATVAGPYNDFAVSRGNAATIGWIDPQRRAHAALLPVTASAVPAQPAGGSGLPSDPVATSEGWADHADLSWQDPPAGEDLTGYALTLPGVAKPILLPPTARGYTVDSVQFGETHYAGLQAFNANGPSANVSIEYAEQIQFPAELSNLAGTLDPATGAVTVSWTWTQQANTDAPVTFDVAIGPYSVTGLTPTTTSVVVQTGSNIPRRLTLTVHGPRADSMGSASIFVSAGYQPPTPTFTTTGLDSVASGTTITATYSAAQGVQPLVEDVRERPASQRTWTYPPSLQGVSGAASIHLLGTAGSAYCFSARATDVDGVLTQWSAPQCTAIPRSDRTMTRVHSWKLLSSPSYLYGTASQSINTSSQLSTTISASKVWVIATTCPTRGTLGFRVGSGTMLLSLHSAATVPNAVIYVPWGLNLVGKISLVQVTSGKPVTVEGIAYLPIPPAPLPLSGGPVPILLR